MLSEIAATASATAATGSGGGATGDGGGSVGVGGGSVGVGGGSVGDGGGVPHIELGVKGEPEASAQALEFLRAEALRLGARFDPPAQ